MQPRGRILYVTNGVGGFTVWSGNSSGSGNVVLQTPDGDDVYTFLNPADNLALNAFEAALGVVSLTYGFDGATWDRIRSGATNADNVAVLTAGAQQCASYIYGFDGATWDRLISTNNSADAIGVTGAGVLLTKGSITTFNGTGYDRWRSQSSTDVALAAQVGVGLTAPPGNWSIVSTPAANTQATISRAAVASTRHICTSLSAVLTAPAAVVSGTVQLNLRDGATGAGTILWSQTLQVGGATSISADRAIIQLSGLQIFGSVNTAMTLEFSAAGGASTLESVSLTGYDVT